MFCTGSGRLGVAAFVVVSLAVVLGDRPARSAGLDQLAAKTCPFAQGECIAFLGDSITQAGAGPNGYVRLIDQAANKNHPQQGVKIVYAGISGNRVPDLQKRLDRDVLSKKPTLVFVYIGINDVWHSLHGRGTPKAEYESGLRDLIGKIRAAGANVVLATPSVIGEKTDGSNRLDKMLDEYAQVSRKVAKETGVTLCDLHQQFADYLKKNNPDNKERGVLTSDGVHLNPAGNRFVADAAVASLVAAAKARTAKDAK